MILEATAENPTPSMRPRHLTVDHRRQPERERGPMESFNEATAFNRGSLLEVGLGHPAPDLQ